MAFYCVDYINGNDGTGDGTPAAPYKTIGVLESEINNGNGFIATDEIRIADSSTRTLIGTGTVATGDGLTITTAADYTSSINIFSTLEFEGSISGIFPIPYRASAVSATTITFPGTAGGGTTSSNWQGPQLAAGETVTIYRIDNAVTLNVTATTSTLDTFINKNYNFNANSESVIISGGWTPFDFTTKTTRGITTFSWGSFSTFQTTANTINGRIFNLSNAAWGFVFKDFAATNLRFINNPNGYFKRVENLRYGYTQPWFSTTTTTNTADIFINNCHFSNLDAPALITAYATTTNLKYYIEDNTYYVGANPTSIVNGNRLIRGNCPTSSGANIVVTRNCTIRSSYVAAPLVIGRFMSLVLPENWDTITLVSLNNSTFRIFATGNFNGWTSFIIYPSRSTTPFTPNLSYTIPNAWIGRIDGFMTEGSPSGNTMPYSITYPGNPLTIPGLPFVRGDANNNPATTTQWQGFSQGGYVTIDSTGSSPNIYPCGYGYFIYNTVDQFSGNNCLEFRSWLGQANGKYGPGLQIIYLEPGQSVTFSAKCKIKAGSSLSSLDVNIRTLATTSTTLGSLNNLTVSSTNQYGDTLSAPTTINNSTWVDVTTTFTNTQTSVGSNTIPPLPFIFGLNFNFGTNTTTSVLIDSYQYTIL